MCVYFFISFIFYKNYEVSTQQNRRIGIDTYFWFITADRLSAPNRVKITTKKISTLFKFCSTCSSSTFRVPKTVPIYNKLKICYDNRNMIDSTKYFIAR